MLRSLLAGVSGLKNHQLRMDVIGNNIANVNTIGFKASRVTFQEGFSQILANATAGGAGRAAMGPSQIGSGVRAGGIESLFTQGSLEATGQPLDLAIQGSGLFVLSNGERTLYSRAGNLQLDPSGRVVLGGSGMFLQGMNADAAGNLTGAMGDLVIPLHEKSPAEATSQIELSGNFDADAEPGDTHIMTSKVIDKLGREHDITLTFTRTEEGSWSWNASSDDLEVKPPSTGTISFDEDGGFSGMTLPDGSAGLTLAPAEGEEITIEVVVGAEGRRDLTSIAGTSNAAVTNQNGRTAGDLVDLRIGVDGTIEGIYGNGTTLTLGQIALANFANPAGLMRGDGNLYELTAASGEAVIGFGGDANGSMILAGALEGSNVDISQEFTNMIITQRGYQANARMISTADALLGELINLRR